MNQLSKYINIAISWIICDFHYMHNSNFLSAISYIHEKDGFGNNTISNFQKAIYVRWKSVHWKWRKQNSEIKKNRWKPGPDNFIGYVMNGGIRRCHFCFSLSCMQIEKFPFLYIFHLLQRIAPKVFEYLTFIGYFLLQRIFFWALNVFNISIEFFKTVFYKNQTCSVKVRLVVVVLKTHVCYDE